MTLRENGTIVLLLCAYGFFKEVKPSEPYLTQYLTGKNYKNLTDHAVYGDVYPIWSYSSFALLVPVFLLTDLVKYKPMIIFEGLSYVVTWMLLLWAEGVAWMQAMQFVYGAATSTEVAYYTYIYAKVPKDDYLIVSGLTRMAFLLGRFVTGSVSQFLINLEICNFRELNFISLTSVIIAFILSWLLPNVKNSVYFHTNEVIEIEMGEKECTTESFKENKGIGKIMFDLRSAYKQTYVVKWSVWVALSTCIYFQVGNYIQPLWEEILPSADGQDVIVWNGAVEAAACVLGAMAVFAVGNSTTFKWNLYGDTVIFVITALGGSALIVIGQTNEIFVAYSGYILFRMSYNMMMTAASFEIARNLNENSYGLVFGINTWVGLGIQSILTFIVADSAGLNLNPRGQFYVYGAYYVTTGLLFIMYNIFMRIITT